MSRQLRVLLASLALVGFLLGSLVLLSYWQKSMQPEPARISKAPMTIKPVEAVHKEVRLALEKALLRSGITRAQLQVGTEKGLEVVVVDSPFPSPRIVDEMADQVRRTFPRVHIESGASPWSLTVSLKRRVVCTVRFRFPPLESVPFPTVATAPSLPSTGLPRLAIVMDDMGRDLSSAKTLLNVDLAVTFSILPYNEQASQVATLGHAHGREVLLHIPMEPKGFPEINPGADALLLGLPDREIRRRFRNYRQRVPYAVGGNNHMGSRFTQNQAKMTVVMEEMRKAGMFFVDSRTSSQSVAFAVARDVGVPVTGRDVFLDNVKNEELIALQIHKLVRLAIRRGRAVGICHPYPQTLEALRREASFIHSQGVEVVPVSQLLNR